jgi:hypothetical protein
MCPACLASAALLVTGVVSTGGVTAVALRLLRKKNRSAKVPEVSNPKEKAS